MEYIPPELICDIFSRISDLNVINSISFTSKQLLNLARSCITQISDTVNVDIPASIVLLYPNVQSVYWINQIVFTNLDEFVSLAKSRLVSGRLIDNIENYDEVTSIKDLFDEFLKYKENTSLDIQIGNEDERISITGTTVLTYSSNIPILNDNIQVLGIFDTYLEGDDFLNIMDSFIHSLIMNDVETSRYIIDNPYITTLVVGIADVIIRQLDLPNLKQFNHSRCTLEELPMIIGKFPKLTKFGFFARFDNRSDDDIYQMLEILLQSHIQTIVLDLYDDDQSIVLNPTYANRVKIIYTTRYDTTIPFREELIGMEIYEKFISV